MLNLSGNQVNKNFQSHLHAVLRRQRSAFALWHRTLPSSRSAVQRGPLILKTQSDVYLLHGEFRTEEMLAMR